MNFIGLAALQVKHREWLKRNFPNQKPHEPLLGLTEEVGELAHAHLKAEQGIRGYADPKKVINDKADAVGDIVIYLASYCNSNNLNLAECVAMAWEEVEQRNWTVRPESG